MLLLLLRMRTTQKRGILYAIYTLLVIDRVFLIIPIVLNDHENPYQVNL